MKKMLLFFCIFLFFNLNVFVLSYQNKSSDINIYKEFYYIENYSNGSYFSPKMILKSFSKEEIKTWPKYKQKNYKMCLSYEKKYHKGRLIIL